MGNSLLTAVLYYYRVVELDCLVLCIILSAHRMAPLVMIFDLHRLGPKN